MKIMDIVIEIQVDFFMAVLLCIILIHAVFVLDKKKDIDKLFIKICMTNILLLILEICDAFLNLRCNIEFITIHKAVNLIGFLLTPIIPILLCNITNSWMNDFKNINKKYKSLFYIPYIIYSFICILSWKCGFFFKISDLNIYSRGGLFLIVPIVSYGYCILNLFCICFHKNSFYIEERLVFLIATLLPFALGLIQIFHLSILTIWNSASLVVIIGYVCILYKKMKTDPLTGLENRVAYEGFLKSYKGKKKLWVIYIDVNKFKYINDNFGHDEGDRILVDFAQMIKNVFLSKGRAMRIGGDEFIILIENEDINSINKDINLLMEKVFLSRKSYRYDVSFSYGIACADKNCDDIKKVIKMADSSMYENKKSNYSQLKKDNFV